MRPRKKVTDVSTIEFPVIEDALEAIREASTAKGVQPTKGAVRRAHYGKVFRYEHRPGVREGEVVVMVIDRDLTVATSVKLPTSKHSKPKGPELFDLATARLAEIQLVMRDLFVSPFAEPDETALTVDEEARLRDGGLNPSFNGGDRPDPVAEGKAEYRDILASSLTASEAAKLLRVNTSRIRQRLGERTIFGIKAGRRAWSIPKFQFHDRSMIPGLDVVLPAIRADVNPVALRRWLTSPNSDLVSSEGDDESRACSPLDWLASGQDVTPVIELAKDL